MDGVIEYGPTGEVAVAVVLKAGEPVTTEDGSLLTKPVIVAVKAGFPAPYARVALFAVTVSVACWTVTVAAAEVSTL
jgi:hypothetical protein